MTAEIQYVGISADAGVPPLGDGIDPSAGVGGDGSWVTTKIGGWSGGPGAVQGHGGQFVIPYVAHAGSTILSVSCDVVPRADATDTWDVLGAGGSTIGSFTVPATAANVIIRGLVTPDLGHRIGDGENVVIRHSFRDAVTGAWTSAAQDMTVISCAVNSVPVVNNGVVGNLPNSRTITLNPGDPVPSSLLNEIQDNIVGGKFGTVTVPFSPYAFRPGISTAAWQIEHGIVHYYQNTVVGEGFADINFPVGTMITRLRASIRDDSTGTYEMRIVEYDNRGSPSTRAFVTSAGNATDQDLDNVGAGVVTILSGKSYGLAWVAFGTTSANTRIYQVLLDVKKP